MSVGVVYIYITYNPTDFKWFPQCPVKQLTGLSCPACGFQRAAHSLLNGDVKGALSYNYFFVIGIPYLLLACIAVVLKKINRATKYAKVFEGRTLAMIYVYCFFAWFVIRNCLHI